MAKNSGTLVIATIKPYDDRDLYPTHEAQYGKGGYMVVADLTARDAITSARRTEGMLVYVTSEAIFYQLIGGITNSDWVEAEMGGGDLIIDVTYSQLYNGSTGLIDTSTLVPGQKYRITDFRTRHIIPNTTYLIYAWDINTTYNTNDRVKHEPTGIVWISLIDNNIGNTPQEDANWTAAYPYINEASTEALIVTALTTSTLDKIAHSESYPQDIIHYEIVCTREWQNGYIIEGADRGWIYYREDTLLKNKLPYDYRNCKWRRWENEDAYFGDWRDYNVINDNGLGYQDFYTFNRTNFSQSNEIHDNDFSASGEESSLLQARASYNNVFVTNYAIYGNTAHVSFSDNTFMSGRVHENNFGVRFGSCKMFDDVTYNTWKDNFTGKFYSNIDGCYFEEDCTQWEVYSSFWRNIVGHSVGGFTAPYTGTIKECYIRSDVDSVTFDTRGDTNATDPWDSGTTYNTGDLVIYKHEVWQSLVDDNTNNAPVWLGGFWDRITGTNISRITINQPLDTWTFTSADNGTTIGSDVPWNVTYQQLSDMATDGSLIPGQKYRITDYRTRHLIPETTDYHVGTDEPLTVTAATTSTLYEVAQSELYPKDIIHYEIVCTHAWEQQDPIGTPVIDGADRGWIYYREDTRQQNKLDYDFRECTWRRWLDPTGTISYNAGLFKKFQANVVTYTVVGAGVGYVEIDFAATVQMAASFPSTMVIANSVGVSVDGLYTTNDAYGIVDNVWRIVVDEATDFTGLTAGDFSWYRDQLTFDTYDMVWGNDLSHIGDKASGYRFLPNYNNVIHGYFTGNKSRGGFQRNTFFTGAHQNDFGTQFLQNILLSQCEYNRIIDNFSGCELMDLSTNYIDTDVNINGGYLVDSNCSNGVNLTINFGAGLTKAVLKNADTLTITTALEFIGTDRPCTIAEYTTFASLVTGEYLYVGQKYMITDRGNAVVEATGLDIFNPVGDNTATWIVDDTTPTNGEVANVLLTDDSSGSSSLALDIKNWDITIKASAGETITLTGTAYESISANGQFLWQGAVTLAGDYGDSVVLTPVSINNGTAYTVWKVKARSTRMQDIWNAASAQEESDAFDEGARIVIRTDLL